MEMYKEAFEQSDFYLAVTECTRKSLTEALNLLSMNKVDVRLKSFQKETQG